MAGRESRVLDQRASRVLNILAAAWMALLGVLILVGVSGRALFPHRITGVP